MISLNLTNIEVSGIDMSDWPDLVDAYISYAEHPDGTPLSDLELEFISRNQEFVYEQALAQLY